MSKKKARRVADEPTSSQPQPDKSPYVHQRDVLDWNLSIKGRDDLTDKQKSIIDLILDKNTKIIFINGPAGTSKTWLAIYCGLLLLHQRRASHITFVRTIAESASKSLGSLPGEAEDKLSPYLMPLMDKLEEMVPKEQVKKLMADKRVVGLPVNFLRGASMNRQYIVLEEFQNFTLKEAVTALTRIGQYSKIIAIGDSAQADINGASALLPLYTLFDDEASREQGIHCISLTKDDIVRSGVLRYITEKLEEMNAQRAK